MAEKLLLGWIGFCGGCLVAGGVVALMVGLGILSRFIEISHTSKHTRLYENCIFLSQFIRLSFRLGRSDLLCLGSALEFMWGDGLWLWLRLSMYFQYFSEELD